MAIPFVTDLPVAAQKDERLARVSDPGGNRGYTAFSDAASAPLCDPQGRLIVRLSSDGGFSAPGPTTDVSAVLGQVVETGSAPAKDDFGLVGPSQRVMLRARDYTPGTQSGVPYVSRMFGYVDTTGFLQLIMRDESGGASPPVLADVPDIVMPVTAGQSFSLQDYRLITTPSAFAHPAGPTWDLATYIALSSTGPTYTPSAAGLMWVYFYGSL